MEPTTKRSVKFPPGWMQVVLVGLVFFLPVLFASWLYYKGGSLQPESRTNHGAILEPIVNLQQALPKSEIGALVEDHWLLIYLHDGPCEATCRESLYTLRQTRLMLGKDMNRVRRVFLHGDSAADRVFLEKRHPGLTVLKDKELSQLLVARYPEPLSEGGFFLVDPRANLVMYFAPDIVPGDTVDDIKHLLDLSQIG